MFALFTIVLVIFVLYSLCKVNSVVEFFKVSRLAIKGFALIKFMLFQLVLLAAIFMFFLMIVLIVFSVGDRVL